MQSASVGRVVSIREVYWGCTEAQQSRQTKHTLAAVWRHSYFRGKLTCFYEPDFIYSEWRNCNVFNLSYIIHAEVLTLLFNGNEMRARVAMFQMQTQCASTLCLSACDVNIVFCVLCMVCLPYLTSFEEHLGKCRATCTLKNSI